MKLTNKYNLSQSLYSVIQSLIYDPTESDPKRVSVTTLINPPRQRLLTVRHWSELEEDVSDRLWALFGIASHYVMERYNKNPVDMLEKKLEHSINGINVVGRLDLYNLTDKSVEDFKFTSVWSFRFGQHVQWEQQLNLYAFLLRVKGYEVRELRVNAILKDWRRGESLRYKDYPKIPYQTVKLKLWTFEAQEQYVTKLVNEYARCLSLSDTELPLCSPEDRWAESEKFAVYKGKNKTATRVLDSEREAKAYIKKTLKGVKDTRIERRVGIDKKCLEYCSCNTVCDYYKKTYGDKNV